MRDWVYNVMYQFARLLRGKANNKYGVKNHHSEMWHEMFVWKPLFDDFFINSPIIQLSRGERVSDASACCKNTADTVTTGDCNRKLGDSGKFGHRLDGIFVSQVGHHKEVGCLETGAKEEDPTGTKVLSDALKLGKALKDQHDYVTKFTAVAWTEFVVHGFQLNGLCIQFVTLDYVADRFLRLQQTKMYEVPTEVSKIMDLLEIMARLVVVFTNMHEAVELLSKPESIDPQSKIAFKRPISGPNSGHYLTAMAMATGTALLKKSILLNLQPDNFSPLSSVPTHTDGPFGSRLALWSDIQRLYHSISHLELDNKRVLFDVDDIYRL
ncbi:hypothetical protein BG006_003255 [Podila minutissima]|uniref:Uncharacterized protein n=1 Tax=Podila minutissima TaxID=64525 RepID=A0A9P5SB59_9FUNG|nr:hypothetical protein BG006_003255 [Podila minutissima]